ncbi:porin [Caballeronia sp. DA-9]|uniref:porin n=1 Tax=Caballeronia sp. DA-9 TaxID=3436237 RepID=UPI003F66B04A
MKSVLVVILVSLVGAFWNAACAQSSVTLYGLVDAAIIYERGGPRGSIIRMGSGVPAAAGFGIKGTEDLGAGTKLQFVLENGAKLNDGTLGQGGLLFGRQAWVGLSNDSLGSLRVGRIYSPFILIIFTTDPFHVGYAGGAQSILSIYQSLRLNNTISYKTPEFYDVSASAALSMGGVAGDFNAGKVISASVTYLRGPLYAALGVISFSLPSLTAANAATATDDREWLAGATYNFNFVKMALSYTERSQTLASGQAYQHQQSALIGATIPIGNFQILANFMIARDLLTTHHNAQEVGLGVLYSLSRRSTIYATAGKIVNHNGAFYTVGNAIDQGSGNFAVNVGISQQF